jgi:hypothetical protein
MYKKYQQERTVKTKVEIHGCKINKAGKMFTGFEINLNKGLY